MNKTILYSLAAVSNLFLRKKFNTEGILPSAPCFPVFGFGIGFACTLTAWTAVTLWGAFAGGAIAGIVLPLALAVATGWRPLKTASEFWFRLFLGTNAKTDDYPFYIMLASLYLLYAVLIGTLAARGAAIWIFTAFTGAYFVRGIIASEGFLRVSKEDFARLCLAGAGLSALPGLLTFSAFGTASAVAAVLCVGLTGWAARKIFEARFGEADIDRIDLFGSTAEIILLAVGVILR